MCEKESNCCKNEKSGYTFKLIRANGVSIEVKINSEEISLDYLLNSIEEFLRGCGFTIPGYLEVVSDEEDDQIKFIEDRDEPSEN